MENIEKQKEFLKKLEETQKCFSYAKMCVSLGELLTMFNYGKTLILSKTTEPSDSKQVFIEKLLLGRPIEENLVVAEDEQGIWHIIKNSYLFTVFYDFVNNVFPIDLFYNEETGKYDKFQFFFKDLPVETQLFLKRISVNVIIVRKTKENQNNEIL